MEFIFNRERESAIKATSSGFFSNFFFYKPEQVFLETKSLHNKKEITSYVVPD